MKCLRTKSLGSAVVLFATLLGSNVYASKFTIAVISDTQNYVDVSLPQPRGQNTFLQQMQYLADTRAQKNLVFASHVGDVVQHGDGQFRTGTAPNYTYWNTKQEWVNADQAMSILTTNNIRFGILPGNHDFDNYSWYREGPNGTPGPGASRPLRGTTSFAEYFGPDSKHFMGRPWYGAGPDGSNSYQLIDAGDYRLLNLSLEQQPRLGTLQWAQSVVDRYPGMPTILTTHEWMDPNFTGSIARSNDYNSYFPGLDHQIPDRVFDSFIRKNDQIFMVLAGHDFVATPGQPGVSNGQNRRIDLNDFGNPVYQFVQDYQGNTIGPEGTPGSANGGAGWLRFVEFDTDARRMHFYTYSTLLNRFAGRNGENTFGTPPDFSDFTLPFPAQLRAQVTSVPEPTAAVLLAIGLVGLLATARRARP